MESRTLSLDAAVDEFIRCATGGASGRAERLLARHPAIATASIYTALMLGDAASVEARLRSHPEVATQPGGPQDWEPLLYACHTSMHKGASGWTRRDRTPPALARCDIPALELLHRFGVDVNGIPGGVPPLAYMMSWATDPAGPRWLLEHGADANLAWGPDGETPLHAAARRWDVPMAELLVQHGADPMRRRSDGYTPHTLAELNGNHDVAMRLLAYGAKGRALDARPIRCRLRACRSHRR